MLFPASSKSSINVGGYGSNDNEDRMMSPVYINSVHRYLALEEHYFNVSQCTWSCNRHTATNTWMTYASWDCGIISPPLFRACFSRWIKFTKEHLSHIDSHNQDDKCVLWGQWSLVFKIKIVLDNLGLWLQHIFLSKEALLSSFIGFFLTFFFFLIAMVIISVIETLKITEREKRREN